MLYIKSVEESRNGLQPDIDTCWVLPIHANDPDAVSAGHAIYHDSRCGSCLLSNKLRAVSRELDSIASSILRKSVKETNSQIVGSFEVRCAYEYLSLHTVNAWGTRFRRDKVTERARSSLDHATASRKAHPISRRRVAEPADLLPGTSVDQSARQIPALLCLENLLQDILLAATSCHEADLSSRLDDWQAQGDALWWWLRGVIDGQDPRLGLPQQRVVWEEGARVAIWTAAEQQQIEQRHLDRVARSEHIDQLLLVLVRCLLRILESSLVDREDLWLGHVLRDLVQPLLLDELVVRVFVRERYAALVGVEDLPFAEVNLVLWASGAARDSNAEDVVALEGFILGVEDVLAKIRRKLVVHAREGVEVHRSAHGCCQEWRRLDAKGATFSHGALVRGPTIVCPPPPPSRRRAAN
ncbi:6-phosphogluconolactonase [Hortaea werneckii]|nr:6-phosphogluconolactonase [Hortaea werneckii]